MITEAKKLYNTKNEIIPFESLHHMAKIKKLVSYRYAESAQYIEDVTIPFFLKQHDYFIAIDYYDILAKYYARHKNKMKSLEMRIGIMDAQTKIYQPEQL